MQNATVWKVYNYTDLLAEVGGLMSALMAGIALLLKPYQTFKLDSSMLKRMYFQDMESGGEGASLSHQELCKLQLARR